MRRDAAAFELAEDSVWLLYLKCLVALRVVYISLFPLAGCGWSQLDGLIFVPVGTAGVAGECRLAVKTGFFLLCGFCGKCFAPLRLSPPYFVHLFSPSILVCYFIKPEPFGSSFFALLGRRVLGLHDVQAGRVSGFCRQERSG